MDPYFLFKIKKFSLVIATYINMKNYGFWILYAPKTTLTINKSSYITI